jgi:hypothetical protein
MPKDAAPGDLAVWYAVGRQEYIAWGWVESAPVRVTRGFGPFRGQVAGMQEMEPADLGAKLAAWAELTPTGGSQRLDVWLPTLAPERVRLAAAARPVAALWRP